MLGYLHVVSVELICENLQFIFLFVRGRHVTLSWAKYIQSTTSHAVALTSVLNSAIHEDYVKTNDLVYTS
jgi:hypothetical protein